FVTGCTKAVYTADLGGLAPEPGCQVKAPGKLLCVETTKTNVSPTPLGAPAGPAAGQFVCYKVKCPKGAPPVVTVTDQFGTHTFTPSPAQLLCAPAQVAPPSTTTTTNPAVSTTTTTSPAVSTTTTTNPAASTTTTTTVSTTTTTAPLFCNFGGHLVGGFCWFAASTPGTSCDSVCAAVGSGSTCSPGTVSYAGTGG